MVDKYIFFREVTNRICGDTDFCAASLSALRYFYEQMPADEMAMAFYDIGEHNFRVMFHATLTESGIINRSADISPEGWESIGRYDETTVFQTDAVRDPVTAAVLRLLNTQAASCTVIPMKLQSSFLGTVLLFSHDDRIPPQYFPLLADIERPLGMAFSNAVEQLLLQEKTDRIGDENRRLHRMLEPELTGCLTLREAETRAILSALKQAGGKISGPGGAAELLDIHPNTLRSKMEKLEIPMKYTVGHDT